MRNILIITLLSGALTSFSQDREKEFQVRIGYGITGYQTDINYTYDDGTAHIEFTDKDSAVTSQIPIELRYELHPRFNLGLDMRFGKYLYDPDDDNTDKSNRFSSFGLGFEGTIVSKPVFRWFGGLTFSGINLEIEEPVGTGNSRYIQKLSWKGNGTRLYTGISWFIADGPVGLNFVFGYDTRNMDLKEYTQDGSAQDLTNISGTLKVKGPEVMAGLVFRIKR